MLGKSIGLQFHLVCMGILENNLDELYWLLDSDGAGILCGEFMEEMVLMGTHSVRTSLYTVLNVSSGHKWNLLQ